LDPNQTLLDSCRGNVVRTEQAMECLTEELWFSSRLRKGNFPHFEPHGSRAHPASYSRSIGASFPGDKAWYWPLTSTYSRN